MKKFLYLLWKYLGIKNLEKFIIIKILQQEYKKEKFQNKKSLIKYGFKVYSQQDEDGIIEEIFKRVGEENKRFIEIGVETGVECNTTYLLLKKWSGLWIEGNKSYKNKIDENFIKYINKESLKVNYTEVNPDNINFELGKFYKKNESIDLLSIDIGVHTFHTLKEISFVNPRVIVTEYNAKFGPSAEWIIDYDKKKIWDGSDNFGASLKSFEKMLDKKGYKLVGCNISGANAFFVRKDCVTDDFENFYHSEYHFNEGKKWLKTAFEKDYKAKIY